VREFFYLRNLQIPSRNSRILLIAFHDRKSFEIVELFGTPVGSQHCWFLPYFLLLSKKHEKNHQLINFNFTMELAPPDRPLMEQIDLLFQDLKRE